MTIDNGEYYREYTTHRYILSGNIVVLPSSTGTGFKGTSLVVVGVVATVVLTKITKPTTTLSCIHNQFYHGLTFQASKLARFSYL